MTKYDSFIGKLLDNKYRILDVVGSGGMAVVLKAEDVNMKRLVAIKILNDEYTGNEQAETRFANEAKAVAMLSHRNIVSIYDIAMYPDMKYIVMEYLDGITLREYLDNKGALPWKEAFIYALQILRALEHAHGKGVIHRDIKPQNVMLLKSGEIKVTDFGIAKLPSSHSLTLTQKAIGTVYYISPEQACGKTTTNASDIYSLGIMLYEAVTGALPFTGDNSVQIAMQQVNNAPQDPTELVPSLPVGAKQIILKALEKDPTNRFSSAHSMAKAIEWLLRNPDVVFTDSTGSTSGDYETVPAVSVSIDMINTTDIEPYGQTEIVESISGEKPKKKKKNKVKKEKTAKAASEPRRRSSSPKSRSMFPIIFGSFFAILLVAIVIGVMTVIQIAGDFLGQDNAEVATYPNIVGYTYGAELEAKLLNGAFGNNFKIDKIIYVENDDYASGQITATEPAAGHQSKRSGGDSDVYFHFTSVSVCKKSSMSVVPDVTYYKSSTAKLLLYSDPYRYKVTVVNEDNANFFDDQVIRTEPAAGQNLSEGGTITLYICAHSADTNKTDKMPNVTELTESEARARIGYARYDVTVRYEQNNFYTPGTVIAQSIAEGTVSEAYTTVIITVAQEVTDSPMENVTGYTYDEVVESLSRRGMNVETYCCYYISADKAESVMMAIQYFDYSTACAYLDRNGFAKASMSSTAAVIYQSVRINQIVGEGTAVSLIFGVES